MNRQHLRCARNGEVSVAVVLICALALWFGARGVYPMVRTGYLAHGKMIVTRGMTIGDLLSHWNMDTEGRTTGRVSIYPLTDDDYRTSTEYFRTASPLEDYCRQKGRSLSDVLGAPGLPSVSKPAGIMKISSGNNAWCITQDIVGQPNDTPLLFTRNLAFSGTTLDTFSGLDKTAQPFGDRFGIVITYGLRPRILTRNSTAKDFNPAGATNRFLRP